MTEHYQLDIFKDPQITRLEAKIKETQERGDRVRKGMYARLNKLQKMYDGLYEEHELFKRHICRGNKENK